MQYRQLHPVIRRNTLLLTLGNALLILVIVLTPTIGPLIILNQTGSIALAALPAPIMWSGRMMMAFQSGRLMDKVGRVRMLSVGFLLAILGTLLLGSGTLMDSFELFLVGLFVFGLGLGAASQNRLAIADMYPAERRGSGIGYFMTISVVGIFLSPVLLNLSAGLTAQWGLIPFAIPWFFAAIFLAVALGTTILVRPDPLIISQNLSTYYPDLPAHDHSNKSRAMSERPDSLSSSGFSMKSLPFLVAITVSATSNGIMIMFMGLTSVFLSNLGVSITMISVAISIHVLGMFALSIPFGKIADRYGRKKVLLVGIFLSVLGAILMPLSNIFWVITLGIFLIGLGWSAAFLSATSVIADVLGPTRRGRGTGINDVAMGIAAISFPIVGGILFEISSFASLGVLSILASIPGLILVLMLKEKSPGVFRTRDPNSNI